MYCNCQLCTSGQKIWLSVASPIAVPIPIIQTSIAYWYVAAPRMACALAMKYRWLKKGRTKEFLRFQECSCPQWMVGLEARRNSQRDVQMGQFRWKAVTWSINKGSVQQAATWSINRPVPVQEAGRGNTRMVWC